MITSPGQWFFDRIGDGLAPVGAHDIGRVRLLETGENVGNDCLRVFRARVVARDDDEVRLLTRDASHLRALAAVPVSAAAKRNTSRAGANSRTVVRMLSMASGVTA